ncbi:hypothetical protein [Pseudescherichia sp.]|uniref:hypothetical protein n=1 Tax=Pseudescherichia sp. TaxID=2055881 RepID=UPI002896BA15|nr:hypothetical protein [Pseudescherichia sp.]
MATFSNNVKVNNFQYKSVEPVYSNQSWTGQRIMRSSGIQYYQIQFQLNFNVEHIGEVNAFLAEYSQGKPFTLSMGHISTYRGGMVGALTSQGSSSKGTKLITTNSNAMAVGELIQFSNHKKIYRIVDRTDTSLTIFPALQNTVQPYELITYNNLMIEAVLDPDNDYSMTVGKLMSITLKATENIT